MCESVPPYLVRSLQWLAEGKYTAEQVEWVWRLAGKGDAFWCWYALIFGVAT